VPTSISESGAAETVRRHFHWCLAAPAIPVLTVPLEWAAALVHRRKRTPGARWWSRWLLALAAADTIISVLVTALVASGVWSWQTLIQGLSPAAGSPPVRIGAMFTANPQRPNEPGITHVADDSPAQRAGLKVSDVLIAIDGVPIRDLDDAIARIRAGEPGVARTFRIRRAGLETDVSVTPERRYAINNPGPRVNAPTACGHDLQVYAAAFLRWRGAWMAAALMIGLWLASRRIQGPTPRLWSWVLAAFGTELLVSILGFFGICVIAGRTIEGMLLIQLVQSLAFLGIGLIAMRHMQSLGLLGVRLEPRVGTGPAVLLGFFYLFAFNLRLGILIAAVTALTPIPVPATPAESVIPSVAGLSALAQSLLALRAVVVAPVAEEVLFRGLILPRLASWMGAAAAVVATSVMFAVLHEGFGYAIGTRAAGIFIVALVLGWARLRTGNLVAATTIHVIFNAVALWSNR